MSFTLPDDFRQRGVPFPLDALKRAEQLGTLNKIDRRPQYLSEEYSKPHALLEAVNVQGNHIRGVQKNLGELQHQLYNLKLRNSIIVSIVTAVLMRAPEIWQWLRGWVW